MGLQTAMTPQERADKVREALDVNADVCPKALEALVLIPPGSIILTPDEAEKVCGSVRFARLHSAHPSLDESIALLGGDA